MPATPTNAICDQKIGKLKFKNARVSMFVCYVFYILSIPTIDHHQTLHTHCLMARKG